MLAPMAGVTDRVFREIVFEETPGLAYTEMISAMALLYANSRTFQMLEVESYRPLAIQLFGSDPEIMAKAVVLVERYNPTFIDVNMGCPTPKIVKNGEGSALMRNPELAARIVDAMARQTTLPISVKFRAGWDETSINAPEFARKMVEAGAQIVTVHGRTRSQFYSGRADWEIIKAVVDAVSVPVIGNGDIDSPAMAKNRLEESGCAGIMIGRGSLGNPWLVGRCRRYLEQGISEPEPTWEERIQMLLTHLLRAVEAYGADVAVPQMRKHMAWYLKGLPGASGIKGLLQQVNQVAEVQQILASYREEIESKFHS